MSEDPDWLMLVSSVPGANQTARMRIWRALKASGAGALRDGVYVLPNSESARALFEEQARSVAAIDGTAQIVTFDSSDEAQRSELRRLFDRGEDYSALLEKFEALKARVADLQEIEARRQLSALRRDATALSAIDYFPGAAHDQVEQALADAEAAVNRRFSPDEPQAILGNVTPSERADYQDRTWATRRRLWVDRVASAWLIRRFIDPNAKFLWLAQPADCPASAVGFDFDGAEFSHIGARVTFEVLLRSFGLESDDALTRLGALVHYLDVGGVPVPEAAGFTAILTGARAQAPDDDVLLQSMSTVLDSLYAAFGESTGTSRSGEAIEKADKAPV